MAKPSNREPTLEELEDALLIDKNELDECIIEQPDTFYRVAKQLELAISRRDAAEKDVDEIEAETDQRIRTRIPDDEKATEGDIKAQVKLDKKVRAAKQRYLDLKLEVGKWGALKDAFKQRSYAFNQLNDLQMIGYFGGETHSSHAKTTIAERAKKAMHEARTRPRND